MQTFNSPAQTLIHTRLLKIAHANSVQTPPAPSPNPHPQDPFAHWPAEMIYILDRYPSVRDAFLQAIDKEVELGNIRCSR